jgi:dolichol-phosphate mannosyltransferase
MSSPPRAEDQPARVPRDPDETGAVGTAATATWALIRRIHLASRQPANWIQLFKFGVVGGSGYVINLVVFSAVVKGAGVHHIIGAILAFCVAVTSNFLLNRIWTFRGTQGHAGFQAARFFAVSLGALGINLLLLYLLADVAGVGEVPAQAVAVAAAMPFNFLGNKLWTFR